MHLTVIRFCVGQFCLSDALQCIVCSPCNGERSLNTRLWRHITVITSIIISTYRLLHICITCAGRTLHSHHTPGWISSFGFKTLLADILGNHFCHFINEFLWIEILNKCNPVGLKGSDNFLKHAVYMRCTYTNIIYKLYPSSV